MIGVRNFVHLDGLLARDPELRYVGANQKALCVFTVASDDTFPKSEKKQTQFVPVKCWQSEAEFVAAHFKKGDPIVLDGKVITDSWEKDGKKHSRTMVQALSIGRLREPTNANETEKKPAPASDDVPF